MNYFRAVLKNNEISERALELTKEVIALNAANYTAWYYRRVCLFALEKDLEQEMQYANQMTEDNQKNYQVWYHRQAILEKLRKPEDELEFIAKMVEDDSKNYHAWAHRQWVVKEFKLWDGELDYLDTLVKEDVRNNSAWNHRFFVVLQQHPDLNDDIRVREIEYAFLHVNKTPNNESPWNYAKGMAHVKGSSDRAFNALQEGAEKLLKRAPINIFGHYALLESFSRINTKESLERALATCDNLIKFDGLRKKYWENKKSVITRRLE
jgi:protein farnesyltransferase/geranylgeranyltransferase type-1 subunit alpha